MIQVQKIIIIMNRAALTRVAFSDTMGLLTIRAEGRQLPMILPSEMIIHRYSNTKSTFTNLLIRLHLCPSKKGWQIITIIRLG